MSYPNPSLGDNYILELETFNAESGVPLFADETPRYYIYRGTNAFPNYTLTGLFQQKVHAGLYIASGVLSTGNGFATGDFVTIHASGKMGGKVEIAPIVAMKLDNIASSLLNAQLSNYNTTGTVGSGLNNLVSNIYYANVKYIKDTGIPDDEYTVQWFRNTQIVPSAELTRPFISVYSTVNGTALISNQAMTYANPGLGVVRYNGSNLITASGEPYQVIVSGVIDGSNRVWTNIVGLDYL